MSHSVSVVNPCPDDAADIVARLRCQSPYLNGSSAEILMNEAADEIERLRAALQQIAMEQSARDATQAADYFQHVARAALSP